MKFYVLSVHEKPDSKKFNSGFLIEDNWNDMWEYRTLYSLFIIDEFGVEHNVGGVKIGQVGMTTNDDRPDIPTSFNKLKDKYFSLGQDDSYYDKLKNLSEEIRINVLTALRDVSYDLNIFNSVINERVMIKSLLRYVELKTVKGQFHRLATGGARLSNYNFEYVLPVNEKLNIEKTTLAFNVVPESNPPTNVHVLIGRNGVGKTHLLNNMTKTLLSENDKTVKYGYFKGMQFTNLVTVSFSAFDETDPLPEKYYGINEIKYSYVGLRRFNKDKEIKILPPKSPTILKNEFIKSARISSKNAKGERWKRALEVLESDPIFKESGISKLCNYDDDKEFSEKAGILFNRLSSGHKIVLLSITRLVECVEEKTLVLLDEPEGHLHPPLIAAFIRAISDLLIHKNGVAIIATHSPVVLQEVPKSCVWKIRRSGIYMNIERLETESFAENVGVLTREVFGLELTQSGYHRLIEQVVADSATYQQVIQVLNSEVGAEGRALIQSLISNKFNIDDLI